jgi:hypothetical protein
VVEFTRANGQKVPVEVQARGAMMHAFWQVRCAKTWLFYVSARPHDARVLAIVTETNWGHCSCDAKTQL